MTSGRSIDLPEAGSAAGRAPESRAVDSALAQALVALRETVAATRFDLDIPGSEGARESGAELVRQLDDYILPRLRRLDAPLLTVVGGSTGAGKSTVVNSPVGAAVTPSGGLRPATRSPLLVCHPHDLRWFSDTRVLPELTRTSGAGTDHRTLQLVTTSSLDPGLAFLDAPDIDSVVAANAPGACHLIDRRRVADVRIRPNPDSAGRACRALRDDGDARHLCTPVIGYPGSLPIALQRDEPLPHSRARSSRTPRRPLLGTGTRRRTW